MYFDFATYFHMLGLALRETNRASRKNLLFMLLLVVPFVSTFHAICFFLDRIFFPGLSNIEVRQPVFLIGHARSGTTLTHRLMARDGERFSSFMLYELFFPSLLQKKCLRILGRFDEKVLHSKFTNKLRVWEERTFEKTNDIHKMSLWAPEEDEFIHTFSMASGFWILQAPYLGKLDFYYVDRWPKRKRHRIMNFYKECVKRQLYLNGPSKTHLSKNPVFCGRVESLIETFPDARIVVLERNPYETIPSLLKLLKTDWELHRWPPERYRPNLAIMAEQSFNDYLYPLEVLAKHPETKQAIIDYRELTNSPKRTIEAVYAALGLSISPAYNKVLTEVDQRERSHETTHRYSLEEFGLEKDVIQLRLSALFERFGWDQSGDEPATPRDGEN